LKDLLWFLLTLVLVAYGNENSFAQAVSDVVHIIHVAMLIMGARAHAKLARQLGEHESHGQHHSRVRVRTVHRSYRSASTSPAKRRAFTKDPGTLTDVEEADHSTSTSVDALPQYNRIAGPGDNKAQIYQPKNQQSRPPKRKNTTARDRTTRE
jgi:hypothetical protein